MAITTWSATTGNWDDSKFSRGWDGPVISPDAGLLSLAPSWNSNTNTWAEETEDWEQGLEPSYVFGVHYSPGVASLEVIQAYEWNQLTATWDTVIGDWSSGPVPHVAIGEDDSPAKADLTLTGYAPAQGIVYTFPIENADLTVTGKIPTAGISHFRSPDKASITGLSSAAWENYGGTWAESSDNWGVGTLSPTVGITYTFPIDEADLTLSGYSPVKVKKDPTYLVNIIVS